MKILKILGIAAGAHALFLVLIFANPGCSYTKAADPDMPPITAAPVGEAMPAAPSPSSGSAVIRYSPTRPGTTVAGALEAPPVSDVTPATTYTIARGDSLSSIATRNHLSKADLAAANNLKTNSVLHVGQKLVIPSKGGHAAAASAAPAPSAAAAVAPASDKASGETVKHVVKPGETLGAIARKYGVRQGEIAVANNITDPKRIQPGQELVIPARSATSGKQGKAAKARADADADTAPAAEAKVPAAASDQDLDAGLKPSGTTDVPVIKIDDSSQPTQPRNP
jgi:LysM repeat protein